jgi:hypothetical protein
MMKPWEFAAVASNTLIVMLICLICAVAMCGCASRMAGQVEAFAVGNEGRLIPLDEGGLPKRSNPVDPDYGDSIRSNDDVITMQVESAYLQELPPRITGSRDVIIFADVWENAAAGYTSESSLTSIIYLGKNQIVPGRLNFRDALAYGPTKFKGHPLRVRFTIMILQKERSNQQASAVDIIGAFAGAAAPEAALITSAVSKVLQGILKAQPDIVMFDFELTLLSDRPEALAPIIKAQSYKPGESTYWLQYGRLALVETRSRNDQRNVLGDGSYGRVQITGGRLLDGGQPVPTNYMVVRITPHQLPEDNELLAAASAANAKMMASLRRSDEDIQAALADVKAQADIVANEALRTQAEKLARQLAVQPNATADTFAAQFDAKWLAVTNRLASLPDRQKSATEIGPAVRDRWKAKFAAALVSTRTSISDAAVRDAIRTGLTGVFKDFRVDEVPFSIKSAIFPGQGPFSTVEVTLATTGDGTKQVKIEAVKAKILSLAQELHKNQGHTGVPEITHISIAEEHTIAVVIAP